MLNLYYVYIKGQFTNKCYIRIRKNESEALKIFDKKSVSSIRLIKENV